MWLADEKKEQLGKDDEVVKMPYLNIGNIGEGIVIESSFLFLRHKLCRVRILSKRAQGRG